MDADAPRPPDPGIFRRKVILPVLELLRQGITPEKIALSIAIGAALGVFPVVGTTTILCTLAAILLKLNLPAIQLVNYLVYPLQLALLLPFLRLGEFAFGGRAMPFLPEEMMAQIRSDPRNAAAVVGGAMMHAILAWLLIGPLAVLLIYLVLAPVLRRVRLPHSSA